MLFAYLLTLLDRATLQVVVAGAGLAIGFLPLDFGPMLEYGKMIKLGLTNFYAYFDYCQR
jgi:hypothetical protein